MMVIASLQEKIKKNDIQFNILYPYFKEGKNLEEILKQKISIIFFNDEKTSFNYFRILKSRVLALIKVKNDLELICRYFIDFYPNAHSEDIKLIAKVFLSLDNNNLNYFELNYKKDYDKYIKYLEEAKIGFEKKSCLFYNQILNESKKYYNNDDLKCIEETEKKFNELRKIFEEDVIDEIDGNLLILCTAPFIEEKDKILSELKKLISIFKISKNNNKIDNIKNDIIIILKREYIINATSSIIFLFDQIGAQKGIYYNVIKRVVPSFKENAKISFLKKKLSFLNNIDIDLLNE